MNWVMVFCSPTHWNKNFGPKVKVETVYPRISIEPFFTTGKKTLYRYPNVPTDSIPLVALSYYSINQQSWFSPPSSVTIVHWFRAFDYGMHIALNSCKSSHVQNLTFPCKPILPQSRFYRGTLGQLITSKRMTTWLANQVRLPGSTLCAWPSHICFRCDCPIRKLQDPIMSWQ